MAADVQLGAYRNMNGHSKVACSLITNVARQQSWQ
jgi:hypothetical protein